MAEYIERKEVLWLIYSGKIMTGDRAEKSATTLVNSIPAADVRPVVTCADCKYNNACLTQAFVEEESRVPFDRSAFFCADGERKREES